jgi:hypothetical protein
MRSIVPRASENPHARVKGVLLIEATRWFRDAYGMDKLLELSAAVPEPDRLSADYTRENFGILPGSWYAAETVHVYCDAMTAGRPRPERIAMARSCATAMMDRTLGGVHHVFFRLLATPERYCAHVQRLWNQSNDTGVVQAAMRGKTRIEASLGEWRGHHPWLCQLSHYCSYSLLEAMGCRGVQSSLHCLSEHGGVECSGWFAWD